MLPMNSTCHYPPQLSSKEKRKSCISLNFKIGSKVEALVDSEDYVSAIAQKDSDIIKQETPSNILIIDDPPNFKIQVANGQSEKPSSSHN